MFQLVACLDHLTAELTFCRTAGTVVGQVLIEETAFERSSATVAARHGVELALLGMILTRHTVHQCRIVHHNQMHNKK